MGLSLYHILHVAPMKRLLHHKNELSVCLRDGYLKHWPIVT